LHLFELDENVETCCTKIVAKLASRQLTCSIFGLAILLGIGISFKVSKPGYQLH